MVVSNDGNTMEVTAKGSNSFGEIEGVEVFDKQQSK